MGNWNEVIQSKFSLHSLSFEVVSSWLYKWTLKLIKSCFQNVLNYFSVMTLHDQGQDVSERERVPMGGWVCMGVCVCWEKEYVQVTRWLHYFFNIWIFPAIKICPIVKIFPKLGSKVCQSPNESLKFTKMYKTIVKLDKFHQIWSHWVCVTMSVYRIK